MRTLTFLTVLALAPLTDAIAQEQVQQPDSKWGRFSASISAGYASHPGWFHSSMDSTEQSSWTAGAGMYLSVSQVVKLGIEGGYHPGLTGDRNGLHVEESLYWATVSTSIGPVVRTVRPYVGVSVGAYWWRRDRVSESQERDLWTHAFIGGSIGVGMETRQLLGPLGFGVQGRWHVFLEPDCNIFYGHHPCFPDFFTLVATVIIG